MLYISTTDIAEAMDIQKNTLFKCLSFLGGIPSPTAKIRSPRSKWPEKGFEIESALAFLRVSPFLTPSVEGELRSRARVSQREMV
ncbi:hypothetical protein SAMN04488077_1227 [Roseovarius tolerans]|uniref:Uncharacterized protein n=1 Tax=Roseovarius tolerans TaxID=74031 RepID=A0A1H8I1I4_9RHOB|nr:hypothetical protein [Roseovarius tolerans]SEN61758.1 hypothetical protein SAMN04488077_1227 [Roseovarius tolerans]